VGSLKELVKGSSEVELYLEKSHVELLFRKKCMETACKKLHVFQLVTG
jgi:hypothetical protein